MSLLIVAITTGEGALWVSTYTGLLIKVDPKTNQAVAQFNLGTRRPWTIADGTLWLGNTEGTTITRANF